MSLLKFVQLSLTSESVFTHTHQSYLLLLQEVAGIVLASVCVCFFASIVCFGCCMVGCECPLKRVW